MICYVVGTSGFGLCVPVLGHYFEAADSKNIDIHSLDFSRPVGYRVRFVMFYDRTRASSAVVVFLRRGDEEVLVSFDDEQGDWLYVYRGLEL